MECEVLKQFILIQLKSLHFLYANLLSQHHLLNSLTLVRKLPLLFYVQDTCFWSFYWVPLISDVFRAQINYNNCSLRNIPRYLKGLIHHHCAPFFFSELHQQFLEHPSLFRIVLESVCQFQENLVGIICGVTWMRTGLFLVEFDMHSADVAYHVFIVILCP